MKPRIGIFLNHPECSQDCVEGMALALQGSYDIVTVDRDFMNGRSLREVDVIAFPGGIGDADKYYDFFKRRHGNAVEDFVQSGGHYLGICMGAYWAGPEYFDILKGLEPVQYIKREDADIRRSYATVANVSWKGRTESMFFYDGCAIIGDGDGHNFSVCSRYANGDAMAIVQGRVGIIGCHPESEKYWYEDKYKYINKYWHEGRHHRLLLDFVDNLLRGGNSVVESQPSKLLVEGSIPFSRSI